MSWHPHSGFPGSSDSKEPACDVKDPGAVPGLGRSPGGRNGNPSQYSCLEKSHEQRRLAGYAPLGHKELDMAKRLTLDVPRQSSLRDTYLHLMGLTSCSLMWTCIYHAYHMLLSRCCQHSLMKMMGHVVSYRMVGWWKCLGFKWWHTTRVGVTLRQGKKGEFLSLPKENILNLDRTSARAVILTTVLPDISAPCLFPCSYFL